MTLSVVVTDGRSEPVDADGPPVDLERWRSVVERSLVTEGVDDGELSVTFVDVDEITELNREHMGVDGPTDVLSFPIDDEPTPGVPRLLGDVVLSPEVAARQFADHAGTYDDEIALLLVHGVLHVLGHDHADADEAEVMRGRELVLLQAHHWSGPAPAGFRQTHV